MKRAERHSPPAFDNGASDAPSSDDPVFSGQGYPTGRHTWQVDKPTPRSGELTCSGDRGGPRKKCTRTSEPTIRNNNYALRHAVAMRRYAHKGLICAYCDFEEGFCVSRGCVRVFGDFRTRVGDEMAFVNTASEATQMTARTEDAANANRPMTFRGP